MVEKSHLFVILCMGLRCVYIRFITVCLGHIDIWLSTIGLLCCIAVAAAVYSWVDKFDRFRF